MSETAELVQKVKDLVERIRRLQKELRGAGAKRKHEIMSEIKQSKEDLAWAQEALRKLGLDVPKEAGRG